MDIKIDGITREIMQDALAQAQGSRLHILEQMNKVLPVHRQEMSDWAPTIIMMRIDPEKIRDVIGKGGSVIRAITEETGATIDIDNDGTVKIASVQAAAGREAKQRIELITADVEVGRIYEGKVARLMDFGAFVTILPGRDGLVHISQISDERVERVGDKLKEGDVVRVKVLEVDRQGRVRLSMRGDWTPPESSLNSALRRSKLGVSPEGGTAVSGCSRPSMRSSHCSCPDTARAEPALPARFEGPVKPPGKLRITVHGAQPDHPGQKLGREQRSAAALAFRNDLQEYRGGDVHSGGLLYDLDVRTLGDQLAQVVQVHVPTLRRVVESTVNVLPN